MRKRVGMGDENWAVEMQLGCWAVEMRTDYVRPSLSSSRPKSLESRRLDLVGCLVP